LRDVLDTAEPMAVIEPLKRAFRRTRTAFHPFWMWQWFVIGIVAFFDGWGLQLFRIGSLMQPDMRDYVQGYLPISDEYQVVAEFLLEQSGLQAVILLPSALIGFIFLCAFMWVATHAQLMFVFVMATNRYDFRQAWRETSQSSWDLFLFRLLVAVIAFIATVTLVLFATIFAGPAQQSENIYGMITPVLATGGAVLALVNSMLRNIVAPLMWRFGLTAVEAIVLTVKLGIANPIQAIAFLVIHVLWFASTWLFWILGGCLTCLIGLIPGFHEVVCAPVYAFDRLFSLYVLESAWPEARFVQPFTEEAGEEEWESAAAGA